MKLRVTAMTMQGKREEQQDSYKYKLEDSYAAACICDGMGGLTGGRQASRKAANEFSEAVEAYMHGTITTSIDEFLKDEIRRIDESIFRLQDEQGSWLKAGTTIAAVIIQENKLYWVSVGDSKLYIFRQGTMQCMVREHNYKGLLEEKLKKGNISRETYMQEIEQGEALVSYLGMGNVSIMDINAQPFRLEAGDKILLCTDGLYRSLSEKELCETLDEYGDCIEITARQYERGIQALNIPNQDNATAIIIACN